MLLFSIYEYFFKNSNACGLPDHNRTWHNKKNTKHRNDREDTLTTDLWNTFIEAIDKKSSIALRQVKDDIDHIHCEYLTCVCVCLCIGSLIKPPNHVCVSNTEILILKMNILVKRRTFLLFLILSVFKCCDSKVASLWIWSWYGCLIIVLSKIKDL